MNLKKVLSILAIGVIVYYFMDESDQSNQPTNHAPVSTIQTQPTIVRKIPAINTYAMRVADNSWPKIDESQISVVDDLGKKNYYLVFDGSGSMAEIRCTNGQSKINIAKKSLMEFISKISNDANIGLLVFDNRGVKERVVLNGNNKEKAIREINNVEAGSNTPLKTAIKTAYKSLTNQGVKQLGYGEYHLVVVTDGLASKGEHPRNIVKELINDSPVVLHTIGFCIEGNHSLNQAGLTLYKSANNPQDLDAGLDSVLAETTDFDIDSFTGQLQ